MPAIYGGTFKAKNFGSQCTQRREGSREWQRTMGDFIFRLNLSFKPKLKPKFGLKPKLIRKNFGLKLKF